MCLQYSGLLIHRFKACVSAVILKLSFDEDSRTWLGVVALPLNGNQQWENWPWFSIWLLNWIFYFYFFLTSSKTVINLLWLQFGFSSFYVPWLSVNNFQCNSTYAIERRHGKIVFQWFWALIQKHLINILFPPQRMQKESPQPYRHLCQGWVSSPFLPLPLSPYLGLKGDLWVWTMG